MQLSTYHEVTVTSVTRNKTSHATIIFSRGQFSLVDALENTRYSKQFS